MKRQTLLVLALLILLCVDAVSTKGKKLKNRLKCCSTKDLKQLEGKYETQNLQRLCKKCKMTKGYQAGGIPLPTK